jgi:hypothetical protein
MKHSKNWIYGAAANRRKKRRQASALLAAACLFFAGGICWGVTRIGDREAPAQETTAGGQSTTQAPVKKPSIRVKGLYVTAWSAGMEDRLAHYIELCDTTEINALVIDVKDDRGQITFLNAIEGAEKASFNIIPDIDGTMALLKEHGIYTIARLVCFKDPLWSRQHPGLAIRSARGGAWKDGGGVTWLDPYSRAAWEYLAEVALEAARLGFDEVQLDYVRFPANGNLKDMDYGRAGSEQTKAEVIVEFLQYMRAALEGTDVRLSADIFGITAINSGDYEEIGQDMELMMRSADYICPMVYPSHFANKRQNGVGQVINGQLFEAPDTQPYDVVYNSLVQVARRVEGTRAGIRPYLQDFTASYLGGGYYQTYTAQQVREQIQAVYDAGVGEWILWNAAGTYSEEALERAG